MGSRGPQRAGAIERHVDAGLLRRSDERLQFTRRGLLLADRVLADLI
jgi:coproporphyrinogen III oxidase-like Fe-S oxidoreductase